MRPFFRINWKLKQVVAAATRNKSSFGGEKPQVSVRLIERTNKRKEKAFAKRIYFNDTDNTTTTTTTRVVSTFFSLFLNQTNSSDSIMNEKLDCADAEWASFWRNKRVRKREKERESGARLQVLCFALKCVLLVGAQTFVGCEKIIRFPRSLCVCVSVTLHWDCILCAVFELCALAQRDFCLDLSERKFLVSRKSVSARS